MNHFKVSLVIHGQTEVDPDVDGRDPYEVPKGLNKFQQIDSGNPLSTQDIITRIIDNRFVERIVYSMKNVIRKKKPKKPQHMKHLKNYKRIISTKLQQFMFQLTTTKANIPSESLSFFNCHFNLSLIKKSSSKLDTFYLSTVSFSRFLFYFCEMVKNKKKKAPKKKAECEDMEADEVMAGDEQQAQQVYLPGDPLNEDEELVREDSAYEMFHEAQTGK